jgi:hypothetical protein
MASYSGAPFFLYIAYMKTLTFLALTVISIGLQSCLKDRTCVCTHYDTSINETVSETYKIARSNRTHAENKCAQLNDLDAQYPSTCSVQ